MDSSQRASIAFLCGCIHNENSKSKNQNYSSIFDFSTDRNITFSVTSHSSYINIFDYDRSCYISGRYPTFFDYGVSQYFTINRINDNTYSIFDYKTNSYLTVTCSSHSITIFDYEVSNYFTYKIK